MTNTKPDPRQVLRSAKKILLVDWPDPVVPRSLLNAGFTVFGFSPGGYSVAEIVDAPAGSQNGFPPRNANEKGYLLFTQIDGSPKPVDIVNIYRPENEHAAIIENHVLPLTAKVVWLHPPLTSAGTRKMAAEKGLVFIEDVNIAELATAI